MAVRVRIVCATLLLSVTAASADPLVGRWVLNVQRSHYGGGAEPRIEETFTCEVAKEALKCKIESVRAGGRKLVGSFTATYDGKPRPTIGIPDADEVILQKRDDYVADATFSYKGRPVFGYRAVRSDDGRSLTVVSVDPTTRVALNSVVVYDRR